MSTKDEAKRFVRGRGYRLKDFDAAQDFFFLMAAFADEQAKTQTSLLQEAREQIQALYTELFRALAVIVVPQSFDIGGIESDIHKALVKGKDFLERSEVK